MGQNNQSYKQQNVGAGFSISKTAGKRLPKILLFCASRIVPMLDNVRKQIS